MRQRDVAWLAGLFEGEGCICGTKTDVSLILSLLYPYLGERRKAKAIEAQEACAQC